MATKVYDTTGQTVAGADVSISAGGYSAFSFTDTVSGTAYLTQVQLELADQSFSSDGGSVTVALFSNTGTGTSSAPGTKIATLGTIPDTQLGSSASLVTLNTPTNITLSAGTQYWVEVTGSSLSNATLAYEANGSGTGTTGQYYYEHGQTNSDTTGATIASVTVTPVCYGRGTRIRTARGEVAVESLAVGDMVVTGSGTHRPVRWLGHNTLDCRAHPHPANALPVRVRVDAFGPGRPHRDLLLSPGHAVCVNLLGEVLVRVGDLINGATIVQEPVDSVEYWHVGLDSHDLLVAEGMPAESYIDVGNRGFFTDGTGLPDGMPLSLAEYCRPLLLDEPALAVLRARLVARAAAQGWSVVREPFMPQLEVDGAVLEPELADGRARFVVPAGAQDIVLTAPGFVPRDVGLNPDPRHLALELRHLRIADGLGVDWVVPATDPRLCVGVHAIEPGGRVWTTPRALLPPSVWDGCRGAFLLTVAFEPGEGRRVWRQASADTAAGLAGAIAPSLRLVHAA